MSSKLPELKSFEAKSSLQHVFQELKDAIMMGEFAPGQKFRIDEFAQVFKTSHMPVREAINQLTIIGALESHPRRSASIVSFSPQRLDDLMDLRLAVEGRAIECAVEKVTAEDIATLTAFRAKMDQLLQSDTLNLKAYLRLNQQFHFSIYAIADNPQLMDVIELAWLRYGPMLNMLNGGSARDALLSGNDDHMEMIEGLRTHDAQRAKDALRSDLLDAASTICARSDELEAG